MFEELFERLSEYFSGDEISDTTESGSVTCDGEISLADVDLSHYTPSEIEEAIQSAAASDTSHAYEVSFGASYDVDARNLAKSQLLDQLNYNRIYVTSVSTDNLWGGIDSYSGDKIYDAINEARDDGKISDTIYRKLIALLKKACHSQ